MGNLQIQFMNSEPPSVKWGTNDFCVVKYAKDNRWYRSKILKVLQEDLYKVNHCFIKYLLISSCPCSYTHTVERKGLNCFKMFV